MQDQVENQIKAALQAVFSVEQDIELTTPDNAEFGDYTTNIALRLSKQLQLPPRDIAQQITDELTGNNIEAEVAGPGFINITIPPSDLMRSLDQAWHENYGNNTLGAGKTALVEFPSPNMAKPYSVGHLRPGNQGWAAKKLLEASGWEVITDNHLGDYGTPFGIWIVGFKNSEYATKNLQDLSVYDLGKIYIATKKRLKEETDGTLATEVQDWLIKLEQGNPEAKRYSEVFNEISLEHIHAVMERLKIKTDYEYGETFYAIRGKELVAEYLAQGIFEKNPDDSVVCRLDDYGIDIPLLVQKSNGAALYATTDLATMAFRSREFSLDKIVLSVGSEQKFYFQQLFAMTHKIGFFKERDTQFVHLWFGTIDQLNEDGTREKMSSRKGVVLLEDLLNKAESRARELVANRQVSDEDVKKIALGAIKFSDFASDRKSNILFDWQSIFSLSGFSGPYIQYAAVRINKILASGKDLEVVDYQDYDFSAEKRLLKDLLNYPEIIRISANDFGAHRIARYLFDLATNVNRYYEKTQVIKASPAERSARLHIFGQISQVICHGLDLLGIEIPEKM